MKHDHITCPHCGGMIEISKVLATELQVELEQRFNKEKQADLSAELERMEQKRRQALQEQQQRFELELADLREQIVERGRRVEQAQQAELKLRKQARALEARQQELEVEVARKLDAERIQLTDRLRSQLDQEFSLKIREREKQIDDLRKSLTEAKRKSEQGSQEGQGEALELNLERALASAFPEDTLKPVPKGMRGADLIQEVRSGGLEVCGSLLWEAKNTKHWSPSWIDKLKDDQREAGAGLAILVTIALPPELQRFGLLDGVWVSDMHSYLPLAVALRGQLIEVAFARNASKGKNEKMEMIYGYLSGNEFRQRVEAIVESFDAMQTQLIRERRAMEKLWKEREKQIQRITTNTIGMYGEMRGIIGATLPEIQALELDVEMNPALAKTL